jgi:hypothetical protein
MNVYISLFGNRQLNSASYYITGFLWVRAVSIAVQRLGKRTVSDGATVFRGVRAEGLS